MIVANCSITKYPAHAALEDPNVDLTDNNLSLAGNGLNVGVSAIRCHRVAIFHLYQFLFTICTDLKLNGCNLPRLMNPAFWQEIPMTIMIMSKLDYGKQFSIMTCGTWT